MRLSPVDIRQQQFTIKMFRGFDPQEVDAFLDDVAEEMKEGAKRDAQLLLRETTLNAEKLMEEARAEEAKLRIEIQSLKRLRRQLIEELRATVERYDRTLAADLGDASDSIRS